MKKVFSNSDLAHVFALQNQYEGRTPNSSFYFYGTELFSYGSHFCIAKFVNEDTVLFTTRTYSNTTSKHLSYSASALSHKRKIYCAYPRGTHADNFNWWDERIDRILKALTTCRKPEAHLHALSHFGSQIETYCEWFKIAVPDHIKIKLNVASTADAKEAIANAAKAEAERLEKEHKRELKLFRSGKKHRMSIRNAYDYIRVDEKRFITSQGVEIPHSIGLKFYELLKAGKVVAGDKLMEYTVGGITKSEVEIGCHRITFKEMKKAVSSKTLQTKAI
jgi:hypothetical protein